MIQTLSYACGSFSVVCGLSILQLNMQKLGGCLIGSNFGGSTSFSTKPY